MTTANGGGVENPYSPGSGRRPPVLVGRDDEQLRARAMLASLRSHQPPPSPLILVGTRGVGKTVLLREVEARARQAGVATVYLTADRDTSLLDFLVSETAHELRQLSAARPGERIRHAIDGLRSLSIAVTVPGVSVSHTPPAAQHNPLNRYDLTRALGQAAAAAREHNHAGLLVLLDEVQETPRLQLRALVNTIQDCDALQHPVALIAAGLPHAADALQGAGSFAERWNYLRLTPLTIEQSEVALNEPALRAGVRWDHSAAHRVLTRAQGSPYLIQLYGRSAWDTAVLGGGPPIITEAHAAVGLIAAERHLHDGLFRGRWSKASGLEQAYLTGMAVHLDAAGIADTADVGRSLGRSPAQLSVPRRRLIDKGIIEPAGYGRVRFTMPGFDRFVHAETGVNTPADLAPLPPSAPPPQLGAGPTPALPPPPGVDPPGIGT